MNGKTLIAQAPVRISFAGGGTDLPEYFERFSGCVLNSTINKYITVKIVVDKRLRDCLLVDFSDYYIKKIVRQNESFLPDADPFAVVGEVLKKFPTLSGLSIRISSTIPAGSGLGTSSAVTVALLGGLSAYIRKRISKRKLAKQAIYLEKEEAQRAGGWQDQYASSFGGFNFIEFDMTGRVSITQMRIPALIKKELEKSLLLFHTKDIHNSHTQQKQLIGNMRANGKSIQALHHLKKIAADMKIALLGGDVFAIAHLMHRSWNLKKETSPIISTKKIDLVYTQALQNGAIGGKLLGAGGGGCLLLFCPVQFQKRVKGVLLQLGGEFIDFAFEDKGFHIL